MNEYAVGNTGKYNLSWNAPILRRYTCSSLYKNDHFHSYFIVDLVCISYWFSFWSMLLMVVSDENI